MTLASLDNRIGTCVGTRGLGTRPIPRGRVLPIISSVALLTVASGCADASPGLLENELLQVVVDAGIDRDGQAVRAYLGHTDPAVRARAAYQAASMTDAVPKAELQSMLDDPRPEVRAQAAFALGRYGDTVGTAAMVEQLRNESDPEVRTRLIEAIGATGGRGAAALLLRTDLEQDEAAVTALALARLGHRGVNNALAVEELIEYLASEDPLARRNAAYYFGRSAGPAFWRPVVSRLRDALGGLESDDRAAAWLVLALAMVGDPADTETLVEHLGSAEEWTTRYVSAAALRPRVQEEGVATALFAALSDPVPHVRTTAANSLAALPAFTEEQVSFTRVWLDEHVDDWRTGGVLLGALVDHVANPHDPVDAWMEQHLDDPYATASGLRALLGVSGDRALERLITAAAGEGAPAAAALETLVSRWPTEGQGHTARYYDAFSAAARSRNPVKVTLAAPFLTDPAMVQLGSAEALTAGASDMETEGHLVTLAGVLRALAATGDVSVAPTLRRALDHGDRSVRLAAADALATLSAGSPPQVDLRHPTDRRVDWDLLQEVGPRPRVLFETEVGDFTIELDAEKAPLSVASFVALAGEGAFDGVPFHRVVPFFVIQGGDVDRGDGFGTAAFRLRTEATTIGFERGTVGMASSGPDTEGSQFFIAHTAAPHLNGDYSAIGSVVEGMDAVDQVERWHRVFSARVISAPPA